MCAAHFRNTSNALQMNEVNWGTVQKVNWWYLELILGLCTVVHFCSSFGVEINVKSPLTCGPEPDEKCNFINTVIQTENKFKTHAVLINK